MTSIAGTCHSDPPQATLPARFLSVRAATVLLCRHLEPEDFVVQSMADVSPVKWHLAHTTWFFEHFILALFDRRYSRFIAGLNAAGIEVNRKVLADLAVTDAAAFSAIVAQAKSAL